VPAGTSCRRKIHLVASAAHHGGWHATHLVLVGDSVPCPAGSSSARAEVALRLGLLSGEPTLSDVQRELDNDRPAAWDRVRAAFHDAVTADRLRPRPRDEEREDLLGEPPVLAFGACPRSIPQAAPETPLPGWVEGSAGLRLRRLQHFRTTLRHLEPEGSTPSSARPTGPAAWRTTKPRSTPPWHSESAAARCSRG
jgi:hypothetical protein